MGMPKRREQAEQEHEALDGESSDEPVAREEPRRLVRARIERHPPGTAGQDVVASRLAFLQELELQLDPKAEPGHHIRADGDARIRRLERILDLGVEESLVPEEISFERQRRAGKLSERCVVALERAVGKQRDARMAHGRSERHAVLVQLDLPCRRRRGLAQYRVHLRKIEIAGSALR